MSVGKRYGDNCDNEGCPVHRDGKCRKNEEFYDMTKTKDEKMLLLVEKLSGVMTMMEVLEDEFEALTAIGKSIVSSDEIDDLLAEIESNNKEQG